MQQTLTKSITTNRMPRRLAIDNTVYHEHEKQVQACQHKKEHLLEKATISEFDKSHFRRIVRERKRGVTRRNNLFGEGSKGLPSSCKDEKGDVRSFDESCSAVCDNSTKGSIDNVALGPKEQFVRELEDQIKKLQAPIYADITDQWFFELDWWLITSSPLIKFYFDMLILVKDTTVVMDSLHYNPSTTLLFIFLPNFLASKFPRLNYIVTLSYLYNINS